MYCVYSRHSDRYVVFFFPNIDIFRDPYLLQLYIKIVLTFNALMYRCICVLLTMGFCELFYCGNSRAI